jgi:hypothetical protein
MSLIRSDERLGSDPPARLGRRTMVERSEGDYGSGPVLERIESQYQLLSEKVMSLNGKIDREVYDLRREVQLEFSDLRKGIAGLVDEIRKRN